VNEGVWEMEASRLLTSEEAAEYLRLDTKTVYRLIDEDRQLHACAQPHGEVLRQRGTKP
jgi:Helix-turn-helix domain